MKKAVSFFLSISFCIATAAAFPLYNLPSNVVGALAGFLFAPRTVSKVSDDKPVPEVDATRILWSVSSGSAWLTGTNWTGSAVPASDQVAQFAVNPASGSTGIGINMSGATNNGANNQIVGAIEVASNRGAATIFGDSSTTVSGTLTLAGVTVNNLDNVILRNASSQPMTLQNIQGSAGARTMNVALGNAAENVVNLDGTGGLTVSSVITGSGRHLTLRSPFTDGSVPFTLSGVNTYTGETRIQGGMISLIAGGSIAQSSAIVISNGGWFDVQGLTTPLTLSSGQILRASGSGISGRIATVATKGLTTAANSPLQFTAFNGVTPPLTISGAGTLTLQSGNPVTVTVSNGGVPLGVGDYKLIAKGTTGSVTGLPTSLTVNGDGVSGAASLVLISGELYLRVTAGTPGMTISPGTLAFGDQLVGSNSSTQNVTISNTGTAALNWSSVFTGTDAAQFNIVGTSSGTIAAGAQTTVAVRFSPASIGAKSANLVISGDDTANTSDTIALSGTGTAPEMDVKGNSIGDPSIADGDVTPSVADKTDFGSVDVNGTTQQQIFTIHNNGNANLNLSGTPRVSISGTHAGDFAVVAQPAASVVPTGVTTFTVAFDPSATGVRSAVVSIANDDPDENPYNFAIQGTGVLAGTFSLDATTYSTTEGDGPLQITVNRGSGSFGAVSVSYTLGVAVNANGAASCTAGTDFVNTGGTLNFADGETSKQVNATICDDVVPESGTETFQIDIQNATNGSSIGSPSSATVTILDNDGSPDMNISTDSASVADGDLTPSIAENSDFGSIDVASGTVARTWTITNLGTVNLALDGTPAVQITGANAADFAVTAQPASTSLTGGQQTTFQVTFDPSATGLRTATVQIPNNDPDENPYDFAIQGTGNADSTAPVISYTPIASDPGPTSLTATVTDAVGVTGVNIFWSINGGTFTSAPCSISGGTAQSGTWSCTIAGAANPSAVAYHVSAADAEANTGLNPAGGSAAPNLFTIGAATVPAGTYSNLKLGSGVSLSGNVTVNENLTLNGIVNAGANKISLGCGATVSGGGEFSYVTGSLEKFFCGAGGFTFNVGAPFAPPPFSDEGEETPEGTVASSYSPLSVNITAGDIGSSLMVSVTDAFLPGSYPGVAASRYWTVTENGDLTCDMSFTYRNEDVNGNENNYQVLRFAGSAGYYPGGTVNAATNTASAPGVSDFSSWSAGVLAPTAANASISGRAVGADGRGLANVTIEARGMDGSVAGSARTNSFGYFTLFDMRAGSDYVVTAESKRYWFAQSSFFVSLSDNVEGLMFVGSTGHQ